MGVVVVVVMQCNVNVEFKVTLHEQVRYRGTLLKGTVCHTAGHRGEEYDD